MQNVSLLMTHLDNENYVLRNGVVQVIFQSFFFFQFKINFQIPFFHFFVQMLNRFWDIWLAMRLLNQSNNKTSIWRTRAIRSCRSWKNACAMFTHSRAPKCCKRGNRLWKQKRCLWHSCQGLFFVFLFFVFVVLFSRCFFLTEIHLYINKS